jgi:hypothetical protein
MAAPAHLGRYSMTKRRGILAVVSASQGRTCEARNAVLDPICHDFMACRSGERGRSQRFPFMVVNARSGLKENMFYIQ